MFFRVKLVTIFLSVVLILLGVVYFQFLRPISTDLEEKLHSQVRAGVFAVSAMHRTEDLAVRRLAEEAAGRIGLRQAMDFDCGDGGSADECLAPHHAPVLEELQSWYTEQLVPRLEENRNRSLRDRDAEATFANTPSLLVVARTDGTVVARIIGDVEDIYGSWMPNLRDHYVVIDECADTRTTHHDVIGWRDNPAQTSGDATIVAAAPIFAWNPVGTGEQMIGVVLVGFPLDDEMAQDMNAALGDLSLLYTYDGGVSGNGGLRIENEGDLREAQFEIGGTTVDFARFTRDGPVEIPFSAPGQNDTYIIGRGAFSADRASDSPAGFLVVGRLSAANEPLKGVAVQLPLLGVLILFLGGSLMFLIIRNFLAPLAKIDHGIQQVITGNRDYVWELDSNNPYHAEMAHALNVMSAFLQGKPLPDEEETYEDNEWAALLQFADVEVTGSYKAITDTGMIRVMEAKEKRAVAAAEAASEPIQAYYQRVFDEYVAARTKLGAIGGITYDRFVAQLMRNAESFKAKANCKDVRFKVVIKDDKVVLKPITIK